MLLKGPVKIKSSGKKGDWSSELKVSTCLEYRMKMGMFLALLLLRQYLVIISELTGGQTEDGRHTVQKYLMMITVVLVIRKAGWGSL